ncbi:MAG: MurR/RpiR family transcriptional regulator [Clostridia bacterium]|nr:MurR/RpiR family transcriptional regulator [Clostridia bacterium]
MDESHDLIKRINSTYSRMSKGQKLISEYIINNYEKAAYMTASQLGQTVGVSESTVVRFANLLEYDGYPKLLKAMRELVRAKLTTAQRIELSTELNKSTILHSVLKADMNNIKATIDEIDSSVFDMVVEDIFKAEKVYIIGLRSAAPIAQFLAYYLNFILDNVKVVTYGFGDIFEQIMKVNKKDLVIGISFPRYSRRTIELLKFSKDEGATIVGLTDSKTSPLNNIAHHTLIARSDMASFVDSLVAPLSLINALIVSVGLKKQDEIYKSFNKLEKIWENYKIY